MKDEIALMKELVERLNQASKEYYLENIEEMANVEYDKLYDELRELEEKTGVVLSNSPTVHVGYELAGDLPKEPHDSPMLSLDKTKNVTDLKEWINGKKGLLSWKLDGITIVLTYAKGKLVKAVTRGNGEIGEVVTNNAKVFVNVPVNIAFKGDLILRGEAIIRYSDFQQINSGIENVEAKFKNPRNLCSGSVRQLNNKITAERKVNFIAFSLVKAEGETFQNSRINQLNWLQNLGFEVVERKEVREDDMEETVQWFSERVVDNDYPSDGLVLMYDDIAHSDSLGATSKFPRDAIAFKWRDDIKETTLREIEWSASRTGLINPIAVFEPVELEGTTVSRASVHNISIMEALELGIGDRIGVFKANMIIPQIAENMTRSGNIEIPAACPVCGEETEIRQESKVKFLVCPNEECLAKHSKRFTHFVSRNAINIDGLSEATLEKLIAKGFIKELADIFHLEQHKEGIIDMEGLGEKSYLNLVASVDNARKTTPIRLLYSLGIPNVGLGNAKLLCRKLNNNWDDIQNATYSQLIEIKGVGAVMAEAVVAFFQEERNKAIVNDLRKELTFEETPAAERDQIFENITFVITGAVQRFENRNELKETIESRGGKVTDSVTAKTDYLINNDRLSNSAKNTKAKELGVTIIDEELFLEWLRDNKKP